MTTDWFTLKVPNGITFSETDTVRYMITDRETGIMVWFIKASQEEINIQPPVYDPEAVCIVLILFQRLS